MHTLPNLSALTLSIDGGPPKSASGSKRTAAEAGLSTNNDLPAIQTYVGRKYNIQSVPYANLQAAMIELNSETSTVQNKTYSLPLKFSRGTLSITLNMHGTETVFEIYMAMKDTPASSFRCVEAGSDNVIAHYKQDVLELTDLFFRVSLKYTGKYRKNCRIERQQGDKQQAGDLVLDVLSIWARRLLGRVVYLVDASTITTSSPLHLIMTRYTGPMQNSMTLTTTLTRGFSYYEKRGCIRTFLYSEVLRECAGRSSKQMGRLKDDEILQLTNSNGPMFLKAVQEQLNYIHMIVTTPIRSLEKRMLEYVQQRWLDSSIPMAWKLIYTARLTVLKTDIDTYVKPLVLALENFRQLFPTDAQTDDGPFSVAQSMRQVYTALMQKEGALATFASDDDRSTIYKLVLSLSKCVQFLPYALTKDGTDQDAGTHDLARGNEYKRPVFDGDDGNGGKATRCIFIQEGKDGSPPVAVIQTLDSSITVSVLDPEEIS